MSTVEVSDEQERRMIYVCFRRGIPAQPILNGYCGNYEMGMPRSMIDDPVFNYEESIWMNTITSSEKTSFTVSTPSSTAPSAGIRCILIIAILFLVHHLPKYQC